MRTKNDHFLHIGKLKRLQNKVGRGFYSINNNKINIFIPNSIAQSSEYSNYALSVYCVLKMLTTTTSVYRHCISPTQIAFYLSGNDIQSRRFVTYIKCGLDELIENNLVAKEKEVQKNYILDCSNLWIDTDSEKFTIITYDDIQKIFAVEKTSNFLLLKYFVYLVGTISSSIDVYVNPYDHKSRVIGNFTMEYLSKISGISVRSIIEYNKILEDIKLLYICRQEDFLIDDDTLEIKRLPNVYGRYEDKQYIETYAANQQKSKESYKWVDKNIKKANTKRRLSQMYNQLAKGNGEKYSRDDISEIYRYVLAENKKYQNMCNKDNNDRYLEKIRDVSIFDNYQFLKENNHM